MLADQGLGVRTTTYMGFHRMPDTFGGAIFCTMDRQVRSSDESARPNTEAAKSHAPQQEQPMTGSKALLEADADAERALRIIESIPGFPWSADAAGTLTYVSPNTLVFLHGATFIFTPPIDQKILS